MHAAPTLSTQWPKRFERARVAWVSNPRLQTAIAALVYIIGAVILTWPLPAHLGNSIYLSPGRFTGDYMGTIANLRELAQNHHLPFFPGRLHDFSAPDGMPVQWVLNIATAPRIGLLWALALVFGATAAVGLFELLGFAATGLATFLLVRRLTGSAALGLIFGWAFAFYPFAAANAEHLDYLHGWVFIVLAWRLIEVSSVPSIRNGLLAGAACVLAMSWNPYYILFAGAMYGSWAAIDLIRAARRRESRRSRVAAHAVAFAVVAVYLGGIAALAHLDRSASGLRPNYLGDLVVNSARPLNFILPPSWNPIAGDSTRHYLQFRGWDANTEKTLYVGWTLLLLSGVALVGVLRRRLPPVLARTTVALAAVVVVAAILSGPPYVAVAGHLIHTPGYYLFQLSSAWRILSRFVIVIEAGLTLLAAIGSWWLLRNGGPRFRAALLVALAVAVPLDLWGQFSPRVRTLDIPRIYSVLRDQPFGVVAEYPLRPTEMAGDYRDLFYQSAHGKPMINGYPARSRAEDRALGLANLGDPRTAPRLATLGVRYVLLERQPDPGVPSPGQGGRGLRRLASDDYGVLFRVTAHPAPSIDRIQGFDGREGDSHDPYRWMTARRASFRVVAKCRPCVGVLQFNAASFGTKHRLTVSPGGGRPVTVTVGNTKTIRVPIRFAESTVITFTTTPGPISVHKTTGSPDTRSVSVFIQAPRLSLHDHPTVPPLW